MRQHYFVVSLMDAWLGVMGVTPLSAQSSGTGVLTGTVTDPSGAVVRNVSVTLTNNDAGQVRAVVTGTGGTYRFPLIPPGAYRVRFAAAGFKVSEVPAVTVNVSETPVLNQTLKVGQQAESVVVQAEAAALQAADSTLGPVVSGSTIADLPLATRNFTQVLGLEAGATSGVNNGTALGQATLDLAVNGAASRGTTSKMDGSSVINAFGAVNAADSARLSDQLQAHHAGPVSVYRGSADHDIWHRYPARRPLDHLLRQYHLEP